MNGGVGDGKQWEKWDCGYVKDERRQWDGYWIWAVGMMTVGMLGVMGGKVMRWDGFDSGDKGMANLCIEEIMFRIH